MINITAKNRYLKVFQIGMACAFFVFFSSNTIFAKKQCHQQISGRITDQNNLALTGVAVQLSGAQTANFITDTTGRFSFQHLCPGYYTITFTEMSFQKITKQIALVHTKNHLHIVMKPDVNHLAAVNITAQKSHPFNSIAHSELTSKALLKSKGENLGQVLQQLPGVSALQSGPTLSKPVIHGLTGSRVLIMNNGVRQEGQQWGDDHAPELDPGKAGQITVVKGADGIRYGSDAIAGVVIMNPPALPKVPGVSGNLNLMAATNGRQGALSGDIAGAFGKKLKGLAWRLQGTLKKAGNFRTPHYFLDNTAMAEGDYSADLGYHWKGLSLEASYSAYNSKIGIFSGSEIDDSTGLMEAYEHRERPLMPDSFTYKIGSAHQLVNHDILKWKAAYLFQNKGKLSLTYARQSDLRQEFAASSGSSGPVLPDDWFKLITHTLDLIYKSPFENGFTGSIGFSGKANDNQYKGLDPRPLIPNYQDYGGGVFAIGHYTKGKWLFEGGLRYDYLHRKVSTAEAGAPDLQEYHHLSATAGATLTLNDRLSLSANAGMGWRPPGVEEMYIYGVHSSAAHFVIGDSTLQPEKSYNFSLSFHYHSPRLHLDADLYDNEIKDFVYLNPIGGRQVDGLNYYAFQYAQDNVRLLGADVSLNWHFWKHLSWLSKATLLRATNTSRNSGLVNMPPTHFSNGLSLHYSKWGFLKQPYFSLRRVDVLQQNYIDPVQKALLPPPPPAYGLWNISFGAQLPVGSNNLNVNIAVDNLTNKVYSDYMNQFRYFAYNKGINFALHLNYTF